MAAEMRRDSKAVFGADRVELEGELLEEMWREMQARLAAGAALGDLPAAWERLARAVAPREDALEAAERREQTTRDVKERARALAKELDRAAGDALASGAGKLLGRLDKRLAELGAEDGSSRKANGAKDDEKAA
jgi:hypothetical protein